MKKKSKNSNFGMIGKNITMLMAACDVGATELSQATGLPCSTISRLRSNTTDFSPNLCSLIPIAEFFCISLSQLIGEEPISSEKYGTFKPQRIRKFPIPLLNSETIASYLQNKNAANVPHINIDLAVSPESFAYSISGNAMEPQFPDNTIIIIDPEFTPENLDHVLVIPNGKKIPVFRQIFRDGEEAYLKTLNPTFNEFIKMNNSSHEIIGVMVQAIRSFKDLEPALMYTEAREKIMNVS